MAVTSAVASNGARRKRPHKYGCGTPSESCSGSSTTCSSGLNKSGKGGYKLHSSPQEAHKCYANYLISQGYKQVGPREFEDPKSHYVTVLTKKSRFGARCRGGKGERFMPERNCGGHIVSM